MSNATAASPPRLTFDLPSELAAGEPPEVRGISRDGVRMLVAERSTGRLTHATFNQLPRFLEPGDLLVINTSGTGAESGLERSRSISSTPVMSGNSSSIRTRPNLSSAVRSMA